ncbi:MAG: OprO/OprP family phosphate-selective porin [Planctomycetota bacterium]|jgi:phosphate-selective porin OprO/OprP
MRHLAALLLLIAVAQADDRSLNKEIDRYLEKSAPPAYSADLNPRWRSGPVFQSEDKAFRVRLRGRVLWDFYDGKSDDYAEPVTENGTFLRQLRLGVIGHVHKSTIFMLELEFSSGSPRPRDVFVGLQNLGNFGRLKIGHMREPFGLDGTTPIPFHQHLERASSTRAFSLGRNLGIRLHNSRLGDGRLTWWIGFFQDSDSSGSAKTGNGGGAATLRITGLPVRDYEKSRYLHLEFSFSYRDVANEIARFNARAGPATGVRLVDTGDFAAEDEMRLAGATALQLGPFTAQAEAYAVKVTGNGANALFHGGYAMIGVWLTGESNTYNPWNAVWDRVLPRRNFYDAVGFRGAVLVSGRVDYIDLTDGGIDGGEMLSVTLGATWMWNPNTRLKLDFVGADIEGGPLGTGTILYAVARVQYDF